jgi:MSHA biogenesis protein MshL
VVLEAKIIEVTLSDGFQAGVNWAAVQQQTDGDVITGGNLSGGGQLGSTPPLAPPLAGQPLPVAPGNPITGFGSETLGAAFALALDIGDFNAFVELLETQGDTRVLSSPRVATLNNQKAVIKAGTDEFFVTEVRSNTVTGTASTTSRDVTLTPFFSGIALDVTPQIDADGVVTLHVHPTVSEVRDDVKQLEFGANETETFPLALSSVREADSIVRARSGQIVVIGGLMQESNRDERFGVPLLSRLPLIGFLFRQTKTSSRKSELVILLKPVVVESDEQWAEEVRRRELRIEDVKDDQRSWWN